MDKKFLTSREAVKVLNIHPNTLRDWDKKGKIETIRTAGNKRLYNVEAFIQQNPENKQPDIRENIIYCRVSSRNQKDDLERQKEYLQSKHPDHRVITDIGSGLNYKRKGFQTLLELILSGKVNQLVVSHKDRLCRFGFEMLSFLVEKSGGIILVQNRDNNQSPEQELTKDLLSIIHVFSCRVYGLRKYKKLIQEDQQNLSV